jgi:DNA-binding MarR family transcriptional regulator
MTKFIVLSPMHRATRQISLRLEVEGKPLGISSPEGHILSYLGSYAPCTVGELHRVFGMKKSTLTSLLDRFEERGWCLRAVDPSNRRSFIVSLTEDGEKMGRRMTQLALSLDEQIVSRLQPSDLEGFRNVMQAIEEVTGMTVRPQK